MDVFEKIDYRDVWAKKSDQEKELAQKEKFELEKKQGFFVSFYQRFWKEVDKKTRIEIAIFIAVVLFLIIIGIFHLTQKEKPSQKQMEINQQLIPGN